MSADITSPDPGSTVYSSTLQVVVHYNTQQAVVPPSDQASRDPANISWKLVCQVTLTSPVVTYGPQASMVPATGPEGANYTFTFPNLPNGTHEIYASLTKVVFTGSGPPTETPWGEDTHEDVVIQA